MGSYRCVRVGRFLGIFLSLVVFANSASATLVLYIDDPATVDPIDIFAGQTSATIPIGVFNDAVPSAPEDFLTGWQIRLEIVPEAGSTGTVTFASPLGPTAPDPPDYVLGTSGAGISVTNGGTTLLALDFNFPPTGGVDVPLDPGALLLAIELQASNDADGEFGIYALTGLGATEWTDATPVNQQRRTFDNVPDGQGPVLLREVFVSIPEPRACVMLGAVTVLLVFSERRSKPAALRGVQSC